MLVTIGGQKGGTGKTTTAVNLATMQVLRGQETLLYDIDPQKTSTLWASMRDENDIHPRIMSNQKIIPSEVINPGIVIRNEIKALLPKYENIVIDAGGADNQVLRGAVFLSDVSIFPIKSSGFDMWTFKAINDLMSICQPVDGEIKYGHILLNEISPNPGEARNDNLLLDEFISDYPYLRRLKNVLCKRKSIRVAAAQGMAIVEYNDNKATIEIGAIYKEIFNET